MGVWMEISTFFFRALTTGPVKISIIFNCTLFLLFFGTKTPLQGGEVLF